MAGITCSGKDLFGETSTTAAVESPRQTTRGAADCVAHPNAHCDQATRPVAPWSACRSASLVSKFG